MQFPAAAPAFARSSAPGEGCRAVVREDEGRPVVRCSSCSGLRLAGHSFYTGCASARGRVSKTQLTPGGTEAACHFHFGVVADKQCTCFASRLMWERYPPTPAFARSSAPGEGCRAEVREDEGGPVVRRSSCSGLRLAGHQFQLRGTRLKHRAKPHKLRQAGVIPAPATSLRPKRSAG